MNTVSCSEGHPLGVQLNSRMFITVGPSFAWLLYCRVHQGHPKAPYFNIA